MTDRRDTETKQLRATLAHLSSFRGMRGPRPGKRRRKDDEGGAAIPADPGPRPLPLEGGAEAPLD